MRQLAWRSKTLLGIAIMQLAGGVAALQGQGFRDRVLREGASLRYGSPTVAMCGAAVIRLEALAELRSVDAVRLRRGTIIGRVHSSTAVPEMSLAEGWSFVYVDSTPRGWRMQYVPESRGARMRALRMAYEEHSDGPALTMPVVRCPATVRGPYAAGGLWFPCRDRGCCCSEPPQTGCIPPELRRLFRVAPDYTELRPAPR